MGKSKRKKIRREDVAIIGMSGRFPGARNIDEFWGKRLFATVVESIVSFTPQELTAAGVDPSVLGNPAYVPAGSVIEDIEFFRRLFF